MKIAMLYASWEDFGEPWSTPQGVKAELAARGHEVMHYNLYHDNGAFLPGKKLRSYSNQGINQLMSMCSNGYRPDVIFAMDYGPWDAVQFDKKYFPGTVLVSEAGDEPQSHRMHWAKASRVHVVLSPDRECVNRYNSAGYHAVYWTHHADHRIFYPRPEIPEIFDCVTTCGSRGGGITDAIQSALGDRFNNERYFYGEEHARRLCLGKIVFQCSQFKEITRRIFEGMACGKMVLTDRLPEATGLNQMFVDGEHIVYYDNAQDAIEKIKYYSDNDSERLRIARNGYSKVMKEHTVSSRVDVLEACVRSAKETLL